MSLKCSGPGFGRVSYERFLVVGESRLEVTLLLADLPQRHGVERNLHISHLSFHRFMLCQLFLGQNRFLFWRILIFAERFFADSGRSFEASQGLR